MLHGRGLEAQAGRRDEFPRNCRYEPFPSLSRRIRFYLFELKLRFDGWPVRMLAPSLL